MEAFIVPMLVVAVGEIGDKTQLLALLLAVRLRRPVPTIFQVEHLLVLGVAPLTRTMYAR